MTLEVAILITLVITK